MRETLNRADKWKGPLTLVVSNVLLAIALLWLRGYSPVPEQDTFLLTLENFIAVLLLFSKRFAGRPALPESGRMTVALLLWALSYCVGYYIFLAFPGAIRLSHFIVVQSLAPLCAVLVTGDWRRSESSWGRLLLSSSPIAFLLLIAWAMPVPVEGQQQGAWIKWTVIGITFLSFLIARAAARVVASTQTAFWLIPRLGLLTGITLLVTQAARGELSKVELNAGVIATAAALTCVVIAAQAAYMYGLANTPPVLSALFISTSVPLAIFMESIWGRSALPLVPAILSIVYCISLLLKTGKDRTEVHKEVSETPIGT